MSCLKCGGPAPTSMCPCGEKVSNGKRELRIHWAEHDRPRRVELLMADFIPAHCLVILAGREGTGKSHLAALLLADLTKGVVPGDWHGQHQRSLVMGTEDSWHSRWVPRLRACGADMSRIARDPSFVTEDEDGNEVLDLVAISDPGNLEELGAAMRQEGITVLYLDHLGTALEAGLNYNSYGDMTAALQRLNIWAEANGFTVIGGWHLSKGGGNVADKVIGSVGLRTSARCVLHVEEDAEQGLRIVAVTKCNDLDINTIKAKSFTIVGTVIEIDGEEFTPSVASGLGEHDHPGSGKQYIQKLIDAAEFRERPKDGDGNPLAADDWLMDYFAANGPSIAKKQVVAWAEPAGYSESAIERAFARIGGQSSSKGGKPAIWTLPTPIPSGGESGNWGGARRSAESEQVDGIEPPQPPQPAQIPRTSSDSAHSPLLAADGIPVVRDVATASDDITDEIEKRLNA